jgi:hypothetical protein
VGRGGAELRFEQEWVGGEGGGRHGHEVLGLDMVAVCPLVPHLVHLLNPTMEEDKCMLIFLFPSPVVPISLRNFVFVIMTIFQRDLHFRE